MASLSRRSIFSSLTSLFVCYSLLILLLPSSFISGAPRTGLNQSNVNSRSNQQAAARREGELLIRFRAGVSEQKKETVASSHGTRRKNQLHGESTVEKLELLRGQNADLFVVCDYGQILSRMTKKHRISMLTTP